MFTAFQSALVAIRGGLLAKPNYQFEKRQRDLAKKSKQEEKRRQKLAEKAAADDGGQNATTNPDAGSTASARTDSETAPET